MANQDNKSFVESVMDAQKQAVETMVENTKKFTSGNAMVNDTIEKGSEWYKNWLDNQKTVFANTTEKATNLGSNAQSNMTQMNEFYQNWFNTQMNWSKQMWDMNMEHMKNATQQAQATAQQNANPMAQWGNMWNNWMNGWNNWNSNMNQANNWMNMMNQWNNNNPVDAFKKASETWTGLFNQYYNTLSTGFADMQKNVQNGTAQDAYRNMINVNEGFTRFVEMWMPFWKSIQEKTFNMDMYKNMVNPAMYKELMDKYFGFLPENSRQYMQQYTEMIQKGMAQASQNGMQQYQQFRNMLSNATPGSNDIFGSMLSGYTTMYNMMMEGVSPITKLITPNQFTKSLMEWNDIANRTMVYNIKNAEMQYMIYNQGVKVMDSLAENIAEKVQKGEDINNMMALYQEWLNISDKVFVSLFESEEYSKIMAETSAMQLRLRKDVEAQLEKYLVGVPVATRSEMDELYKTIYDLKKQVRQMEKMLELDSTEEIETEEKAAVKKGKKA